MDRLPVTTTDPDQVPLDELAGQLARRREAARRLPALADGRRDPLLEAPASDPA